MSRYAVVALASFVCAGWVVWMGSLAWTGPRSRSATNVSRVPLTCVPSPILPLPAMKVPDVNSPAFSAMLQRVMMAVPPGFLTPGFRGGHYNAPAPILSPFGRRYLLSSVEEAFVRSGFSPNVPRFDPRCIGTDRGGLGHLFEALQLAIVVANYTDATLTVAADYFGAGGMHGAYPWFDKLLGANIFFPLEQKKSSIQRCNTLHDVVAVFSKNSCNTTIVAVVGGNQGFCGGVWCGNSWKMPVYRLTRPIWLQMREFNPRLRERGLGSRLMMTFLAQPHRAKNTLLCVWHIRNGDVVLSSDRQLIQVATSIETAARAVGLSIHHHVASEWELCRPSGYWFCAFADFLKQLGQCTFSFQDPDEELMRFMIDTDVLVATGSSYPLVAAQVAPESQVLVMMPRKESPNYTYFSDRGDASLVTGYPLQNYGGVQMGLSSETDGFFQNASAFTHRILARAASSSCLCQV